VDRLEGERATILRNEETNEDLKRALVERLRDNEMASRDMYSRMPESITSEGLRQFLQLLSSNQMMELEAMQLRLQLRMREHLEEAMVQQLALRDSAIDVLIQQLSEHSVPLPPEAHEILSHLQPPDAMRGAAVAAVEASDVGGGLGPSAVPSPAGGAGDCARGEASAHLEVGAEPSSGAGVGAAAGRAGGACLTGGGATGPGGALAPSAGHLPCAARRTQTGGAGATNAGAAWSSAGPIRGGDGDHTPEPRGGSGAGALAGTMAPALQPAHPIQASSHGPHLPPIPAAAGRASGGRGARSLIPHIRGPRGGLPGMKALGENIERFMRGGGSAAAAAAAAAEGEAGETAITSDGAPGRRPTPPLHPRQAHPPAIASFHGSARRVRSRGHVKRSRSAPASPRLPAGSGGGFQAMAAEATTEAGEAVTTVDLAAGVGEAVDSGQHGAQHSAKPNSRPALLRGRGLSGSSGGYFGLYPGGATGTAAATHQQSVAPGCK